MTPDSDLPQANPPAADQQAVDAFYLRQRGKQIGPWASDHWQQTTRGFSGVAYVIIDALCRAIGSSTVNVVQRKAHVYDTSGNQEVRRSSSTGGMHESDEEWEPIEQDHPARKVFEQPNPRQSIADILYEMTLQESLTGSSHTWSVLNGYGEPCEQYVIPTILTMPLPVSVTYPNGAFRILPAQAAGSYAIMPNRAAAMGATLPAERVIISRRPHPWIPYDGYSPLQAAEVQLDVLKQIDIARASACENGVEPSLVCVMPPGTSEANVKALQEKLDNRYAGPWQHRKVLVISGGGSRETGGVEIMPWSKGPAELGATADWEQLVKFASALYGVMPMVSGLVEAENYASFFAALKQFYTQTLMPLAKRIAWLWTQNLILPYWGSDLRCQIEPPAIDDKDSRRADITLLAECEACTVDELRMALGYKAFGDAIGKAIVGVAAREHETELAEKKAANGGGFGGSNPESDRPKNADGVGSLPNRITAHTNGTAKAGTYADSLLRAGEFHEEDHPRDDSGKFGSGSGGGSKKQSHHERVAEAIASVSTRREGDLSGDYDLAEQVAESVKHLTQPELFKVLVDGGVEGLRKYDTKAALLHRLRNRITAAVRSNERAEV